MSADDLVFKPVAQSAIDKYTYLIHKKRDVNGDGTVFGGCVMSVADQVAGEVARRHSGVKCRTALVDSLRFLQPALKGEHLVFKVAVNRAWRTSMEIGVKVFTKKTKKRESRHIVSAYFTFVGVDDDGKPTKVPAIIPETQDELRRYNEAGDRRAHRLRSNFWGQEKNKL